REEKDRLDVTTLDELEAAARNGDIRELKGFGAKTEQNILDGIAFARQSHDRFLLGFALPEADDIVMVLESHVSRIAVAGSLRRRKETIGDVDILAVADSDDIMEVFTGMDRVEKILVQGDTKSSVRLEGGLQVDLRIVGAESFGSALQYFTGSRDHNIAVRQRAIRQGYKLNEYGLFDGDRQVAGETEEAVYGALGLAWIPPELRENRGEVDAAEKDTLPDLVTLEDVKGDLQMHTTWSDGSDTVEEMAKGARKLGHEYIAITDHVGSLRIAGGMDADQVAEQAEEIQAARDTIDGIHIFHGVEANIMKDGSLDVGGEIFDQVDVVLAGVHSAFRMDEAEMTERLVTAIEHPAVDIIPHPTCRRLQKREPISVDMEKVLQAAADNNVVMEINAYPERLDLNDAHARRAKERGVMLSIGTDAHRASHLRYYELGVAVARRGWLEKGDVINTLDAEALAKRFKAGPGK
ncbi:MAG: DNA polymerase/3'-5' exonuclease PolX, partial [Candidatus Thermoplasmatota archaeon]|nr:DNA polymerase/3'-5' exonuclease PolX [Candidatus Thermoplasmatota archaeon]